MVKINSVPCKHTIKYLFVTNTFFCIFCSMASKPINIRCTKTGSQLYLKIMYIVYIVIQTKKTKTETKTSNVSPEGQNSLFLILITAESCL